MVYLFALSTILFPNSYFNVNPRELSFVDDIKSFESYPWGLDVYEKLLRELGLWKGNLIAIKNLMAVAWGEKKPKLVHMTGCALILYIFVIKYSPTSSKDLIGVLTSWMLEWDAIPQHKSLQCVQGAFFGTIKQVIMELIMMADAYHLLVGLKEEMVV